VVVGDFGETREESLSFFGLVPVRVIW